MPLIIKTEHRFGGAGVGGGGEASGGDCSLVWVSVPTLMTCIVDSCFLRKPDLPYSTEIMRGKIDLTTFLRSRMKTIGTIKFQSILSKLVSYV